MSRSPEPCRTPAEGGIRPSPDFDELARKAEARVRLARGIADGCREDEALHRVAMQAVFVLEDTLFALRQIACGDEAGEGDGRETGAARRTVC